MPVCRKCDVKFPNSMIVDGKARNMQRRKFCIDCSPYGTHNTKQTIHNSSPNTKRCPVCNIDHDISSFLNKGKRINGQTYCKGCLYNYQIVRWHIRKIKAIEYLGNCCNVCGIKDIHPSLFDFHHRIPSEKDFQWDKMRQVSEPKLFKELDKCDVVCVFCHRLHHVNHDTWKQAFQKLNLPYPIVFPTGFEPVT